MILEMIIGDCPYEDCDNGHMLEVPDAKLPMWAPVPCEKCKRKMWILFSRVWPEAMTDSDFRNKFEVDDIKKTIKEKHKAPEVESLNSFRFNCLPDFSNFAKWFPFRPRHPVNRKRRKKWNRQIEKQLSKQYEEFDKEMTPEEHERIFKALQMGSRFYFGSASDAGPLFDFLEQAKTA